MRGSLNNRIALTGNMVAADLLLNKTGYKDNPLSKVTGSMPNNSGDVAALSSHAGGGGTIHVVPAEGYTDGSDDASVITDADFVAANIKKNVNVFGVTGTLPDGTATAASVSGSVSNVPQGARSIVTGLSSIHTAWICGGIDVAVSRSPALVSLTTGYINTVSISGGTIYYSVGVQTQNIIWYALGAY